MYINTYREALDYLEDFIGKVVFKVDPESIKLHPPLDRMKVLLKLLDNPQDKFKSVLVGGTSGKGSTAYLISHMLTTAGYKTGLTISPHLQEVNERLQINGKQISDKEFTKMAASMIRIIEEMRKMSIGEPSYFEILIAMAFLYFAEQKVDIAVVEVGMGGEFDATNTLYPLIAVLTNVSLDHTNILGATVQKIAKTKSGIIKYARGPVAPSSHPMSSVTGSLRALDGTPSSRATPRLIVVTGVKQPSVIKIVEDRCRKVGAKLYRLHKDFKLTNFKISLLGEYQKENASLAIETVRQLADFGFKVSEENIKKALKTAFFPGRFEIIKCHPELVSGSRFAKSDLASLEMLKQVQHDKEKTVILDGAHNPTKMKAFLTSLKKLFPKHKKIFVVGFKFDKDIPRMLKQITKVADKIIITEFDRATDMSSNASADALNIKNQMSKIKTKAEVIAEKDSKKAFDLALNISVSQYPNINSIIVVTGSLYLVGEVRSFLL